MEAANAAREGAASDSLNEYSAPSRDLPDAQLDEIKSEALTFNF